MSRSSQIVLVLDLLFALYVITTARRLRLGERTVLGWLAVCGAIAALAIWRKGIDSLSAWAGIYYPPSALFALCCGALLWLLFRLSLHVSLLDKKVVRLAQDLAIANAHRAGGAPLSSADPSAPPGKT